jgi:alanyl aminopeptidase
VRIDLVARERIRRFRFHAEGLEIARVTLRSAGRPVGLTWRERPLGIVHVALEREIAPGPCVLEIEFSNQFATDATSLYRMESRGLAYSFTDFEATRARMAFPCWDEPEFKIPYRLTLTIPVEHMAIANAPIESARAEAGFTRVTFEKTEPLPSYLVAFATGPFDTVAIPGMSIPGRIVTTRGQTEYAGHAARMTPPLLAALEAYFGMRYPYKKLDLLAVPDYWWGAMENAAAITFADNVILIPDSAGVTDRRDLASTLAHELAHMWFGDLVTLAWWDDLWLNESFANWLGTRVTQQVLPELDVDVRALDGIDVAREVDARRSTRAVRAPVAASDNLDLLFDDLAYAKGEAVLGMFEQWMSPEVFREGVRQYTKTHAWGNATSADLWKALSAAAGRDVAPAMSTFLDQPGIPLVTAGLAEGGKLHLRQTRFSSTGPGQPDLLWRIPITLKCSDGRSVKSKTVLLTETHTTVDLPTGEATVWVHPNAGERGYYRWDVGPEMLRALSESGPGQLDTRERKGLVSNAYSLLQSGKLPGGDYLELLRRAAGDPEPQVVEAALGGVDKARRAFADERLAGPFAAYVREALAPALNRIGIEPRRGESDAVASLRPELMRRLGDAGRDEDVLARARSLANAYLERPGTVDPSLVSAVLRLSSIGGDRARFDRYRARFESTQNPSERVAFLEALAWFDSDTLVDRALAYALQGPLRPNEIDDIPKVMVRQRPDRNERVWTWMTENYRAIAARTPPTLHAGLTEFAGGCSIERLDAARTFFASPAHRASGTEQELEEVAEKVRECVGLRERESASVAGYLQSFAGAR